MATTRSLLLPRLLQGFLLIVKQTTQLWHIPALVKKKKEDTSYFSKLFSVLPCDMPVPWLRNLFHDIMFLLRRQGTFSVVTQSADDLA